MQLVSNTPNKQTILNLWVAEVPLFYSNPRLKDNEFFYPIQDATELVKILYLEYPVYVVG